MDLEGSTPTALHISELNSASIVFGLPSHGYLWKPSPRRSLNLNKFNHNCCIEDLDSLIFAIAFEKLYYYGPHTVSASRICQKNVKISHVHPETAICIERMRFSQS